MYSSKTNLSDIKYMADSILFFLTHRTDRVWGGFLQFMYRFHTPIYSTERHYGFNKIYYQITNNLRPEPAYKLN